VGGQAEHVVVAGGGAHAAAANNNKLVLILTRHTLARAGLANRLQLIAGIKKTGIWQWGTVS